MKKSLKWLKSGKKKKEDIIADAIIAEIKRSVKEII